MYFLNFAKKIIREREFRSLIDELLLRKKTRKWQQEYKSFNHFYKNQYWQEAVTEAEKVHDNGYGDAEFYQKGAYAYKTINQKNEATEFMMKALNKRSQMTAEAIIQEIETQAFPKSSTVTSSFVYLGGTDNLGFIRHLEEDENRKKKYLTKIIPTNYPYNHFAYKEYYFYEKISRYSIRLKQIIPKNIHTTEKTAEQLLFMTFEEIESDRMTESNLSELLQLQQEIAEAVPYQELVEHLKVTDKGKATSLSSLMHKKSTYRYLFEKMKHRAQNLDEDYGLDAILSQLEKVIFESKLYEQIIPAEDYVFCHRDFKTDNILYDGKTGRYYVIDWSSYGLGLKGADAAKLLARWGLSFQEIKEQYLDQVFDRETTSCALELLFVYQLIIEWMNRLDTIDTKIQIEQCIRPAAAYIGAIIKKTYEEI